MRPSTSLRPVTAAALAAAIDVCARARSSSTTSRAASVKRAARTIVTLSHLNSASLPPAGDAKAAAAALK